MGEFNINSRPVAHMVSQIRAKQLATRDTQFKIQASIVETWEEQHQDTSGDALYKQIIEGYDLLLPCNKLKSDFLKTQNVNDIGIPILYNKTDLQLKMAYNHAKEQEDNLIEQIKKGEFYNGLSNTIDPQELPILQSDNKTSYWGTEAPSVSTLSLKIISTILNIKIPYPTGAATFYRFPNHEFVFPDTIVYGDSLIKNGMLLFGDYQYGAHRYFNNQLVFGPEDCSSSVGKATGLTTEQVKSISTREMRENPHKYGYELVTILNSNIDQKTLELIEPGDIYFRGNHTAIIATKPDNDSNITTLQFARDIEEETEKKLLGGGLYDYNLITKASEEPDSPIYIFRPANSKSIGEGIPLFDCLNRIDTRYEELFPKGPSSFTGDCSIFFDYTVDA